MAAGPATATGHVIWETIHGALAHLGRVPPAYALGAVGLLVLGHLLVSLRWQAILRGMGHPVPLRETFVTNLCSVFVNNVTPGRVGGEIFRVALLRHRTGIEVGRATVSLAYDRLTDVIPVGIMVALALPTLRHITQRIHGALLPALALVAVAVAAGLGLRRLRGLAAWLARWRERSAAYRVRPADFGRALGYSTAMWALDLVRLLTVAAAFGVLLTPWQALTLSVVSMLGGLAPTIGGLGAIEGGLTAALCLFGVPADTALAITLLERAISYVLSSTAGGLLLLALGGSKLWRLARAPRAASQG